MSILRTSALSILIVSVLLGGCSKDEDLRESMYSFVLTDSLRLEIPLDFHFVSRSVERGKFLCYSPMGSRFYIFNTNGNLLSSFNHAGEGPSQYNPSIYQAGIYEDHVYIQDISRIHKFDIEGNHIWSQRYPNPLPGIIRGAIQRNFTWINDSTWINPFSNPIPESHRRQVLDTLSTIEIFELREDDEFSKKVAKINFEQGSLNMGELIYPAFHPQYAIGNNNSLWLMYTNDPTLYAYSLNDRQIHLDKQYKLELRGFKPPKGATEDEINKPFNNANLPLNANPAFSRVITPLTKLSGLNSSVAGIYPMENDRLFILYTTGIPDEYGSEDDLRRFYNKSRLLGAIVSNGATTDSGILIPSNKFEGIGPMHVLYLGGSRWLILQDNLEERDFYTAYIYELMSK